MRFNQDSSEESTRRIAARKSTRAKTEIQCAAISDDCKGILLSVTGSLDTLHARLDRIEVHLVRGEGLMKNNHDSIERLEKDRIRPLEMNQTRVAWAVILGVASVAGTALLWAVKAMT